MSTDDDHETTDPIDAIKPGTRIVLYAETAGWEGESPDSIMGTSNPTLVLIDGKNYTIGWNEGDGAMHNLEIRDAEGNVGYGLKTDLSSEGGDDQFLEFTANAAMDHYVCQPHSTTMVGDIQIK
ncbi:plastocyanin/azurin family copper-binding protein [Natronorubrum thiooxidans]|uniref:plastocyanin/azurin family copper-binding protein n=1 Tax=Natronorubrum thiooxidans TaxID=308853 RepID=UPI001F26C258|nr:plastocyanin/azurin family copper-binding protein [Natronorubrum thiooxidans]